MDRGFPPVDAKFVVVAYPSGWELSENIVGLLVLESH